MNGLVIGIDPGLTRCGWAVIKRGRTPQLIACGLIKTDAKTTNESRLVKIFDGLDRLLGGYAAEDVAEVVIERPFFTEHNPDTAFGTAQVAGFAMVLASKRGIAVSLLTPTQVKLAVTNSGKADKAQIGRAITRILGLSKPPKPADTSDAVAIALTGCLRSASKAVIIDNEETATKPTNAQKIWHDALKNARQTPRAKRKI